VLVPIQRPQYLNIPYFAMPHPSSRKNEYVRRDLRELPKRIGRQCAAWVFQRRENIDFIRTRNYLPLKTAVHLHWLAFPDRTSAQAFLAAWAHHDSQKQLEKLSAERGELVQRIDRRLQIGRFDLSRLPEQDRLPVARRYIDLQERVGELSRHIQDLELAASLGRQWSTQISQD